MQTPRLSKRADTLLQVALAIVSPLLFLGLLEGLGYVWEQQQANGLYAWELVASRRMVWISYLEPGDGYTLLKPNSHYVYQGIPADINSRGLRGPETTLEKPPATYRILDLGDSIAMGWGIRIEDTYGSRLEHWLNAQKTAGEKSYEVVNTSAPGWNNANELAYLQAEGLKYQPDLVLLDLTLANDIFEKSAVLADNGPALIKWLRDNTYFWPFLTVELRWLQARAQGRQRIDVLDPPTDPAKYFPLDPGAERWNVIWDRLLGIQRLATANHAKFVLIIMPLEFQVLDERYPTVAQDVFKARAAAAGITVLDPLPAFQQACRQKPGGACQFEDRYLFADVWMHPSALGHKLVADGLEPMMSNLK